METVLQPIKSFRCWDKANNEWHYYTLNGLVSGRETDVIYDIDHSKTGQYIGLKDRNDKEICEGDILKCILDLEEQEKENRLYDIGIVHFNKDELRFENRDFLPLNWGGYMSKEIIGNVQENPELVSKYNLVIC